jgi:predicted TIM-barrel fold metal-dependent hydrolase
MALSLEDPMSASPAEIREKLDHPIIDGDGHTIEFVPAAMDHLRDLAGDDAVQAFLQVLGAAKTARGMDPAIRRAAGLYRMTWWAFPARNGLDRATAMLPALLNSRLDELGVDYMILYPTIGLTAQSLDIPELRQAGVRAFNRYHAEEYGPYSERMTVAALIPNHTPEEAIAELDYAVGELGAKAVLFAGQIRRPFEGHEELRPGVWIDNLVVDSLYDYDPVWRRCEELGVAPVFHSSGMGWGSRVSPSSYVFNHLGSFAVGSETMCRAVFMGGVAKRFPGLRFGFLEGGMGWAGSLYADLIGHYEKRNAEAVRNYDPAEFDMPLIRGLYQEHGSARFGKHMDELEGALQVLSDPDELPEARDEFAQSGISRIEQIPEIFDEHFHFGCEAEDPMNGVAFDAKRNPFGAKLRAVLGTDIGHWDLSDMLDALPEAYEQVTKGLMSEDDFRAFTHDNVKHLYLGGNPDFFKGTVLDP